MVLTKVGTPLEWTELPDRQPGPGQIRVKVSACGVCRTDLHVIDGELPDPLVPIIPGHEIIGRIDALGAGVIGLIPCLANRDPWYQSLGFARRRRPTRRAYQTPEA